jgi:hypothetical protein
LEAVHGRNPYDMQTLLWLVETNLTTGDKREADRYIEKLLALGPFDTLVSGLKKLNIDNLMPQTSQEILVREIAVKLKDNIEVLHDL